MPHHNWVPSRWISPRPSSSTVKCLAPDLAVFTVAVNACHAFIDSITFMLIMRNLTVSFEFVSICHVVACTRFKAWFVLSAAQNFNNVSSFSFQIAIAFSVVSAAEKTTANSTVGVTKTKDARGKRNSQHFENFGYNNNYHPSGYSEFIDLFILIFTFE